MVHVLLFRVYLVAKFVEVDIKVLSRLLFVFNIMSTNKFYRLFFSNRCYFMQLSSKNSVDVCYLPYICMQYMPAMEVSTFKDVCLIMSHYFLVKVQLYHVKIFRSCYITLFVEVECQMLPICVIVLNIMNTEGFYY